MKTDHRRPLAAFVLVALAGAFVIAQSMRAPALQLGPGPSVQALVDTSLLPSEAAARLVAPFDFGSYTAPVVEDDTVTDEVLSPMIGSILDIAGPTFGIQAPGDGAAGDDGAQAGQTLGNSQFMSDPPEVGFTGNEGTPGPGPGFVHGGGNGNPDGGTPGPGNGDDGGTTGGGGIFVPPVDGGTDPTDPTGPTGPTDPGNNGNGNGPGGNNGNGGQVKDNYQGSSNEDHPFGEVGPKPGKGPKPDHGSKPDHGPKPDTSDDHPGKAKGHDKHGAQTEGTSNNGQGKAKGHSKGKSKGKAKGRPIDPSDQHPHGPR